MLSTSFQKETGFKETLHEAGVFFVVVVVLFCSVGLFLIIGSKQLFRNVLISDH